MRLKIRVTSALVLFLLLTSALNSFSQSLSRVTSGLDIGTGISKDAWSPSLLYYQNLSLAGARWAQIGWGIRTWGYYGGNQPSLFAPSNVPGNDSITFGSISANGVSFLLGVNFRFKFVEAGVNADIATFALGRKRQALYKMVDRLQATDSTDKFHNTLIDAAPRNLNALPWVWKQNNGIAEAYVRFWIHQRIGIKLGYMIGRVAYRTKVVLNNDQKNFADSYAMPYAAISLPIFN